MASTFFAVMIVAGATLWFLGVRRSALYWTAAGAVIAGALALLVSPTPDGYSEALDSDRFAGQGMAVMGPRVAGVLFGSAVACLLAAAVSRKRITRPEDEPPSDAARR